MRTAPSTDTRANASHRESARRAAKSHAGGTPKGVPNPHLERELKRIVGKALDALKNPAAIPSQIILSALVEARKV